MDQRIAKMINDWNITSRAITNIHNDDRDFLNYFNLDTAKLGIVSQFGVDLIYYDTNVYNSDKDAILHKRKDIIGGFVDQRGHTYDIVPIRNVTDLIQLKENYTGWVMLQHGSNPYEIELKKLEDLRNMPKVEVHLFHDNIQNL